jgi:hypothetical protein
MGPSPSVVSTRPGRLDLFARGLLESGVWQLTYEGQWDSWESRGGLTIGAPTAVARDGAIELFCLTDRGEAWHKSYADSSGT